MQISRTWSPCYRHMLKGGPRSSSLPTLMPQNLTDSQTGHSKDDLAQKNHGIHHSIQSFFSNLNLFGETYSLRGRDRDDGFFLASLVQGHKLKYLWGPNGSWKGLKKSPQRTAIPGTTPNPTRKAATTQP